MYPLSDKDLDRMSREAAEQFSAEPQASGWDQLESRLDKELPTQKDDKKRRVLWLFLILFITCGSGLFWLLETDSSSKLVTSAPTSETKESTTVTIPEQQLNQPSASTTQNGQAPTNTTNTPLEATTLATPDPEKTSSQAAPNTIIPSRSAQPAASETVKAASGTSTVLTATKQPKSYNKNNKRNSASEQVEIRSSNNIAYSSGNNRKRTVSKRPTQKNPVTTTEDNTVTTTTSQQSEATSTVTTTTDNSTDNKPTAATSAKPEQKDTVSQPQSVAVNETKPSKTSKIKNGEKGFSFGILTGFDYSRIHSVGDNKPGYDIGIQVAYQLNKRWSVNTGLILTKKNYTAAGTDFHPPKHYWTTYITLDEVEGSCKMLDIPLNIRYNLSTTKNKWFISGGLSSYIMTNQNYSYYYTVNSNPRAKDWSMNSQTNYWLSVMNISGGIEKSLSRNLTLQAEPYIKVPLKGVGFGNMNINSYGLMAILKFHPVFKH